MRNRMIPVFGIVAALVVGAAMPAAAQQPSSHADRGTYLWLHPKLGLVKVDRTTHAMVPTGGVATVNAPVGVQPQQSTYWLDPKGNFRLVKTPARATPQAATAEPGQ